MTQLEDSRIIALFYERSEQAIYELSKKYGAAVQKTAANILNNAQGAEECVNDTYLGVWNSIPPQNPKPLVTYVCKIARNLAISKLRASTAVKRNSSYDAALDELEEAVPALENVETEFAARELSAAISQFLDTLSYADRFMFVRRYWYADPVSDIAAMMHTGSHRVSVRLSRTRNKLQHYLTKEGLLL